MRSLTGPPPLVGALALVASWHHPLSRGSDFAQAKPMMGGARSAPLIDDQLDLMPNLRDPDLVAIAAATPELGEFAMLGVISSASSVSRAERGAT